MHVETIWRFRGGNVLSTGLAGIKMHWDSLAARPGDVERFKYATRAGCDALAEGREMSRAVISEVSTREGRYGRERDCGLRSNLGPFHAVADVRP